MFVLHLWINIGGELRGQRRKRYIARRNIPTLYIASIALLMPLRHVNIYVLLYIATYTAIIP